jgi:simple sugar transport system substrate-binding protein
MIIKREGRGLKKIIASLLIIYFPIFFTNCARNNDLEQKEPQEKMIILGFSQIGTESNWRAANTKSIKTAADEEGIKLIFSDAHQDQENQILAIRSFIAKRVDVIAFSPVVETGWDSVLQEAKDASIPVIVTDRNIETKDETLYISTIGSNFNAEGERAGKWLVYDTFDVNRDINIVELKGNEGSTPTVERKKGFESVISSYDKYNIIRSENADFLHSKGKEIMKSILQEEEKIDVLFAHNDDMAIGAIEAIEECGLKPGEDIIIISIDGIKEALELIKIGKINCSIECNPLIGDELMELAKGIVNGNEVPKKITIEDKIFTKNNIEEQILNREY